MLDPAEAYDRALLHGIADFSTGQGHWRISRPPPFWEGLRDFALISHIKRCQPDGLVLIEQRDMRPFRRLGIPMVVSPYRKPRIDGAVNLVTEHAAAGRMAAKHLIECGFERFAFCGYRGMFWSDERFAGFAEALMASGFSVTRLDPPGIQGGGYEREEKTILEWLHSLPKPVGIFAAIDVRAWQIAGLCATEGIAVPDDVGILGMDNDELLCATASVPLSSVAITARLAGHEAARRLDRIMRGNASRNDAADVVVKPTHVEARLSTDFVNIGDPALVKALRFIRSNPQTALQVEQVARAAGISRRALEKRFRARLDRPVSAEIRRVRVEAFSRMLRESNRSIAEIADQLGFPGPEHVSRFFKAETGLSPLTYRRRHAQPARRA